MVATVPLLLTVVTVSSVRMDHMESMAVQRLSSGLWCQCSSRLFACRSSPSGAARDRSAGPGASVSVGVSQCDRESTAAARDHSVCQFLS